MGHNLDISMNANQLLGTTNETENFGRTKNISFVCLRTKIKICYIFMDKTYLTLNLIMIGNNVFEGILVGYSV